MKASAMRHSPIVSPVRSCIVAEISDSLLGGRMPTDTGQITDRLFYVFAHPLYRRRFHLALVFSIILFPVIAVALIAGTIFLVVPLIAFVLWLSSRVFFARLLANSILVSQVNYPRVNALAEEIKTKMRYEKPIYIFVYEQGSFNAYMSYLFFRRAIFLTSELLETGVSDDEVRWLVGRFIGYLRARRQAGVLGWLIRAAQKLLIFNVFLLPFDRAMVYTGDRIAVAVIGGDISSAISAMQKLLVGRQLGYSVNPEGIIEQQRKVKGSFFAFLARLMSAFPHMTSRYVDLIVFAKAYFPAQYARFAAANPGLPADLATGRIAPIGCRPGSGELGSRSEAAAWLGMGHGNGGDHLGRRIAELEPICARHNLRHPSFAAAPDTGDRTRRVDGASTPRPSCRQRAIGSRPRL